MSHCGLHLGFGYNAIESIIPALVSCSALVRRRQVYHKNQARGVRNPVYVALIATRFFIKY